LDKLAFWYVEWRYDKQVEEFNESQPDMEFKKAEVLIEDGNTIVQVIADHPGIAMFAEDMAKLLDESGAENYVSFEFMPRLDRGIKPVEVTIGWARKLSPLKKAAMLEKRVAELEQSLNKEYRAHQLSAAVADARLEEMERLAKILQDNGLGDHVGKWVINNEGKE